MICDAIFAAVSRRFRQLVEALLRTGAGPLSYAPKAFAVVIITIYLQHDGCGQYEYSELQLPDSQVVCTTSGCQALINGAWRVVLLERP